MLTYLNLLYSNAVTYSTKPSLSLTVPPLDIAAASYYVAEYDPTRRSLGWQLGFEGPATIRGTTLSFSGADTSFTFAANANYYFAVYAISASAVAPTAAPSIAPIVPTAAPSNTPGATPTPTATPIPSSAPTASATPEPNPTTVKLTSGGTIGFAFGSGVSATLTLPVKATSTMASVATSKTAPTGIAAAPGSDVFVYMSVTPATSITFTSGTIAGTVGGSGGPNPGDAIILDLLVPGNNGAGPLGWLSSPATTSATTTLSFSYTLAQPIKLYAGSTYVFAIAQQ